MRGFGNGLQYARYKDTGRSDFLFQGHLQGRDAKNGDQQHQDIRDEINHRRSNKERWNIHAMPSRIEHVPQFASRGAEKYKRRRTGDVIAQVRPDQCLNGIVHPPDLVRRKNPLELQQN